VQEKKAKVPAAKAVVPADLTEVMAKGADETKTKQLN